MRTSVLIALLCILPTLSMAQRADSHAPIGVMGDHTHGAGEFMLSYRYMFMQMDGNRVGTTSVGSDTVVDPNIHNFLISPINMPMQMHMFGLMYAPLDRLTLMLMVPITSLQMDHITRAGGAFTTASSGLADVKLSALYLLVKSKKQSVHLNLGVSLPTGSIETSDVTPASAPDESQLPYPMQLGSGTLDLMPGITYLGQAPLLSWGGQLQGQLRLGENGQAYRLGHVVMGTAWGAYKISPSISASARLEARNWGDIEGAAPAYANAVQMRMVPTVFPELRGGTRVDAGLGVNLYLRSLSGLRVALEALVPVAQDLHGPQLETDWQFIAGLQYAF